MNPSRFLASLALASLLATVTHAAAPAIKVMLLTGQSSRYHDWTKSAPLVKTHLDQIGLFAVDVVTTPAAGADMAGFAPKFSGYAAVVMVYEGAEWPAAAKAAFVAYMKNGGGLVVIHDTDNAFPFWPEWNEMIGVGGWGGRNEKSGPYLRFRDGKWTMDTSAGRGGSHGKQHEFALNNRAPQHPIMQGLPAAFMHRQDELYNSLRGPAKNVTVLASAMSPKDNGSGEEEPMLMVIPFGKGRVVHDALGHGAEAVHCVAFAVTLQRGTEWAATGKVTQKIPAVFPDDKASRSRP